VGLAPCCWPQRRACGGGSTRAGGQRRAQLHHAGRGARQPHAQVTANGTLQPTRSINIGSELSGTVLKVNVDVNDRIKKGQVLVVLDTAKLRDQILRSQAALASAKAKVAQATATVQEARPRWPGWKKWRACPAARCRRRPNWTAAAPRWPAPLADQASARPASADAQAALSTDQINLSKASIVAPADGVVLTRTVDPGNAVAASLQAVTLFTVAETWPSCACGSMWTRPTWLGEGGPGRQLHRQRLPGRAFPARITRVGFGSTITDNVVTYLTYLDVDNADLSLRPGMTATATITATQRKDVLLVPNTALRFTPTRGPRAALRQEGHHVGPDAAHAAAQRASRPPPAPARPRAPGVGAADGAPPWPWR
jgi:HlyD family secretion protein